MHVALFVGPTLHGPELALPAHVRLLPPARCGDVLRAVAGGARMIAIVDGYFDHQLAVWHKEILWALTRGVHVSGAASMGALRAAELEPFGMVGVGRVFEWYRDSHIQDDDEVAIVHSSAEHSYAPLSDAMVNIRATLERALAQEVLDRRTHDTLLQLAKQTFYPERRLPDLLQRARPAGLSLQPFEQWLARAGAVDQKREDALLLVEQLATSESRWSKPYEARFELQYTELFHELMRRELPQRE